MRYLQLFEKFGISQNIEDQCKKYFEEIQKNKTENQFNFLYKNEIGNYYFKVIIYELDDKNTKGQCSMEINDNGQILNMKIYLVDRYDYATLLHELKHLDYATRKPNFYKSTFHKSKNLLSGKSQVIFYLLDKNEFESKYHGYYVELDNYISKNVSDEPTSEEIYNLFKKFLDENEDKSWTWYINVKNFEFEDYLTKSEINNLFHNYINDKGVKKEEYSNFIDFLKIGIKKILRTTFNKYSKEEVTEIQRSKRFFEAEINKRLPIFRKKFLRLVTLMVDKYCK